MVLEQHTLHLNQLDGFGDDSLRQELAAKSKSSLSLLQPYLKNSSNNVKICENSNNYALDSYFETEKALSHIQAAIQRIPISKRHQTISNIPSHSVSYHKLTYQELAQHLISLRVDYIQRIARPMIQKLMLHPKNVNIFNTPVDPIQLNIPTYFIKIQNPMDLGTIRNKLQIGGYESLQACYDDVRLVFNNAILFNGSDHYVAKLAMELIKEFEHDLICLQEKLNKDVSVSFSFHLFISFIVFIVIY